MADYTKIEFNPDLKELVEAMRKVVTENFGEMMKKAVEYNKLFKFDGFKPEATLRAIIIACQKEEKIVFKTLLDFIGHPNVQKQLWKVLFLLIVKGANVKNITKGQTAEGVRETKSLMNYFKISFELKGAQSADVVTLARIGTIFSPLIPILRQALLFNEAIDKNDLGLRDPFADDVRFTDLRPELRQLGIAGCFPDTADGERLYAVYVEWCIAYDKLIGDNKARADGTKFTQDTARVKQFLTVQRNNSPFNKDLKISCWDSWYDKKFVPRKP